MANRLAPDDGERPGAALAALAAILAVSVGWWALALWPAGIGEPTWLERTRLACFGSRPGGLPDAGGWILLVGEPLGMLGTLVAGWGRSLRRDLRVVFARPVMRLVAVGFVAPIGIAGGVLGDRVAHAWTAGDEAPVAVGGVPQRIDRPAPLATLVDQRSREMRLSDSTSHPSLLGFAYGHCATVCPSIVNELREARTTANRPDVAVVIVTTDPWRDTPDRLSALADRWGLGPRDRLLSGSVPNVEAALDDLGVARRRNQTTGDIDHATVTMLLDERGRVAWRLDGPPGAMIAVLRRAR